jgi:hypothetical protein
MFVCIVKNQTKMIKKTQTIWSAYSQIAKTTTLLAVLITGITSCSSDSDIAGLKETTTQDITESTKGVVTTIKEVTPGEYKIDDEKVIENKDGSYVTVENLDGSKDSTSLQSLRDPSHSRSFFGTYAISSLLMGSLAGTYFNRNMSSVSVNPSNYSNSQAYNNSQKLKGNMVNTARTRPVSAPSSRSKGYGTSRSFRSFGG